MAKIEIVQQNLRQMEKNVLDVYQLQIIGMYEEIIKEENILEFHKLRSMVGYSFWFEESEGRLRFRGCDPKYLGFNGNQNIHEQFEWNVIWTVRDILTDWHKKKLYDRNAKIPWYSPEYVADLVPISLTKRQRGVLTKILKIEKKRQKSFKCLSVR